MKNHILKLSTILFLLLLIASCSKDEVTPAQPELPPYESMAIDFSKFKVDDTKSALVDTTMVNWTYSSINVGFWSGIVGLTLAVPIASFHASFKNKPVYLGDNKWEWKYDVKVLAATHKARLTGQILTGEVKWEMYVSREGVGAYDEFKWFEGTSKIDRTGGQWILYHSQLFQEKMMTIDWTMSSEVIGEITYTYVREKNNLGVSEPGKGSFLKYGLQEGDYDAYYKLYFYDLALQKMVNVDIEWSTSEYFGHVKAADTFKDEVWHCWDSKGFDAICE